MRRWPRTRSGAGGRPPEPPRERRRRPLPVYCETFLNPDGSFPAEPVNTLTSFAPVILGVLALVYLIRGRHRDTVAYVLAVLTVLTGVGSIAWHSMRTEFTLLVDWLPGAAYFVILAFFWALNVGGRYIGLLILAALFALAFLIPFHTIREYWVVIFATLVLLAVALVAATWWKGRAAFAWAVSMIGFAVAALVLRMIDLSVCDTIPVGTHFFWHIFLGVAAFCGVWMIVRLRATRAGG